MHNWRLLLLVFVGLLRSSVSFSERRLVNGGQQCCERRSESTRRISSYDTLFDKYSPEHRIKVNDRNSVNPENLHGIRHSIASARANERRILREKPIISSITRSIVANRNNRLVNRENNREHRRFSSETINRFSSVAPNVVRRESSRTISLPQESRDDFRSKKRISSRQNQYDSSTDQRQIREQYVQNTRFQKELRKNPSETSRLSEYVNTRITVSPTREDLARSRNIQNNKRETKEIRSSMNQRQVTDQRNVREYQIRSQRDLISSRRSSSRTNVVTTNLEKLRIINEKSLERNSNRNSEIGSRVNAHSQLNMPHEARRLSRINSEVENARLRRTIPDQLGRNIQKSRSRVERTSSQAQRFTQRMTTMRDLETMRLERDVGEHREKISGTIMERRVIRNDVTRFRPIDSNTMQVIRTEEVKRTRKEINRMRSVEARDSNTKRDVEEHRSKRDTRAFDEISRTRNNMNTLRKSEGNERRLQSYSRSTEDVRRGANDRRSQRDLRTSESYLREVNRFRSIRNVDERRVQTDLRNLDNNRRTIDMPSLRSSEPARLVRSEHSLHQNKLQDSSRRYRDDMFRARNVDARTMSFERDINERRVHRNSADISQNRRSIDNQRARGLDEKTQSRISKERDVRVSNELRMSRRSREPSKRSHETDSASTTIQTVRLLNERHQMKSRLNERQRSSDGRFNRISNENGQTRREKQQENNYQRRNIDLGARDLRIRLVQNREDRIKATSDRRFNTKSDNSEINRSKYNLIFTKNEQETTSQLPYGNWQSYIFYILQGIYLCSVLMQIYGNKSEKNAW